MSFAVLLLVLSLSYDRVNSDPRATEAALICNTNNTAPATLRRTFIANFLGAMDAVTPQISRQGFAAVEMGSVYAFGECLRDLSASDCNLCFANLKTQILRCLPFQLATRSGSLFFDGCYLRYDDHNFFNESLGNRNKLVCSDSLAAAAESSSSSAAAASLVRRLVADAPVRDGFSTGSLRPAGDNFTVYGLAQCWRFVRGSDCRNCLANSVQKVQSCSGKREARILNAGCYLRYSDVKFYDNSTSIASGHGSRTLAIVSSVTSAGLALIIAGAAIGFFLRRRVLRKRREEKQLGSLLNIVNKSKLSFSYEVLEKATDYFSSSNKLGQGGSGSVYKGVLPDGKTVAIKRLFFNTRQWVDHFFNEVNLISGIRHKNLVELLGCSITGPESLLVYEYVPNQSVYDNLFGAKKNLPILRWATRHKIVLGTAEGLAHLHEESNLRIIHRDVKLSNVLLDQNMEPKVADFGLARLFPEDKTHISTAIAGTLGYMAPEYIVRGKLSEKADVYSFGVLVIELVSGRKNNTVYQNSRSILETVWNLHGTGNLSDAIDPSLEGNFEAEEASRLLQIGLVCVQASAELRPSMSSIVKMIKDNHEIPKPTQPPFLHTNSVEIGGLKKNKSQQSSSTQSSRNTMTESWIEPR